MPEDPKIGPPTCEFARYVRPRVATSWLVSWRRPIPTPRQASGGGPPLKFHETRDNLAHRTYDACMPEPESPSKVSAAAPVASGRGHVGLPPRMADVAKVAGVSHQTTLDPGDLAGSLPCPRDSHRKGQT